jgi:hypothetical protein
MAKLDGTVSLMSVASDCALEVFHVKVFDDIYLMQKYCNVYSICVTLLLDQNIQVFVNIAPTERSNVKVLNVCHPRNFTLTEPIGTRIYPP